MVRRLVVCLLVGVVRITTATTAITPPDSSYRPMALQTGPDKGSSIATAVIYNPAHDSVIIVGTARGNAFQPNSTPSSTAIHGCFMASLQVDGLTWLAQQTLDIDDSEEVQEECTNVLQHGSRLIVTGHAEQGGGLLEQFYDPGGYVAANHLGMLLDLEFVPSNSATLNFVGGHLMQQVRLSYPVAATGLSGSDVGFVVSMETDSDSLGGATLDLHVLNDPTQFFVAMANVRLDLVVTQILLQVPDNDDDSLQQSLNETWRIPYGTLQGQSVYAAGLHNVHDTILLLTGTTAGQGLAFGNDATSGSTDLDGFVAQLSAVSGQLVGSTTDMQDPSSIRIASQDTKDDYLAASCLDPKSEYLYVVGSTFGTMNGDDMTTSATTNPDSLRAFVSKIQIAPSLSIVWTRHLGAPETPAGGDPGATGGGGAAAATRVRATSCTVTMDNSAIYIGGVVENGALLDLSGTTRSYGGDDVFVAKFTTDVGKMEFVRQVGSERDDELALRGGLATHPDGNLLVVGNTYGSMYRQRSTTESAVTSDVFVVTVSGYNGDIVQPIYGTQPTNDNNAPNGASPAPADTSWIGWLFFALFVPPLGIYLMYCFCYGRCSKRARDTETDRTQVLQYLNDFDVEDVDLKHSATGGWHCSYAGPLSHGINNKHPLRTHASESLSPSRSHTCTTGLDSHSMEHLTAPLTGTSVVDDLFFDDDDEGDEDVQSRSGLDSNGVRRSGGAGYEGLVQAYNRRWEEERVSGLHYPPQTRRSKPGAWGRNVV